MININSSTKDTERTWSQIDPKQFSICYISESMFFFFFNLEETFFAAKV